MQKFWAGGTPEVDDFGFDIKDEFIDGKTKTRSWAIMSPKAWEDFGCGQFGTGYAQRYKKQPDGKWLKVEG